jgi:hypothetical protein
MIAIKHPYTGGDSTLFRNPDYSDNQSKHIKTALLYSMSNNPRTYVNPVVNNVWSVIFTLPTITDTTVPGGPGESDHTYAEDMLEILESIAAGTADFAYIENPDTSDEVTHRMQLVSESIQITQPKRWLKTIGFSMEEI